MIVNSIARVEFSFAQYVKTLDFYKFLAHKKISHILYQAGFNQTFIINKL
nr:MAG TPA: hypothetical protein [Caudoviricetes sp.]